MADVPQIVAFPLTWSEDWSVGNAVIDGDHKAFIELANLIHMCHESGDDKQALMPSLLTVLNEYVGGHFLREEKALRSVRYSHFDEHRRKHDLFRGRLKVICEEYSSGYRSVVNDLHNLVAGWLVNHILSDDMRYRTWLSRATVDNRPLAFLSMEAESSARESGDGDRRNALANNRPY
ncbi:bacteriohemerythrin [Magnetospirillum sp. UT-4]|uniref:bacteriohemerythrin n=1 Tax=Magnetospirillum sp. UT-4 TaxID=2681467 RepID=UPI00137F2B88|nr:hemerythrin family protein [Magnetospirillum sp. UT-4]CAA7622273.1 Hemerythrin-like protein [Magnetospirillum sp. UT-4]